MSFRNKRVLITAGPTWVPIDSVRVISNRASGETGILLAQALAKKGAKVTLVLGPVSSLYSQRKINLIRFIFFDQLKDIIVKELKERSYDIIIHSAAVSDFRPKRIIKGKLDSDKAQTLKLVALPKIIGYIKQLAPLAKLIMFKLEAGISDRELILRARKALRERNADFVVANKLEPGYKAYILDSEKIYSPVRSKEELCSSLTRIIAEKA